MAAKKTTKKSAPKKAAKKSPAKAAKKPAAKKAVKKSPAKKAPAKKAVAKKAAPAKKAAKPEAAKKEVAAPKKAAPAKAPKKPAKKVSRKASLGGTPPPPAPVKPRFVPPKSDFAPKSTSGGTGSHSAAFIKKQGQRLLDLRDSLVDSMTGMARETMEGSEVSGNGEHQGDAGSDAYDRDFALSLLSKEQDALYEVEQALYRIKAGTYGSCEISGHKIPTARLEAIPFARLTVECQADWEKEYGNRRFKPSGEVGFSGGIPQEEENSVTVSLDGDDD